MNRKETLSDFYTTSLFNLAEKALKVLRIYIENMAVEMTGLYLQELLTTGNINIKGSLKTAKKIFVK